ncbi:LysR family transcriptional regulator [Halovulum marinum]|nr:LysR family transcriptional regulator [Halovulum marinum]
MELHQIRYFLALSKILNFTAAAEACHVSQPALSRAISQLEGELGGALFRRERKLTHLTEFGRTVLPSLRQCFEASQHAKVLARSFHHEGHAPLSIALSRMIDIDLLAPVLAELGTAFPSIEVKIFRGSAREIALRLKNGDAEVAIADPLPDEWERFETRALFEQAFGLLLTRRHRLAGRMPAALPDLASERFLSVPECGVIDAIEMEMRTLGVQTVARHEVDAIEDIPSLVRANFGLGIWPLGRPCDADLMIGGIRDHAMRSPVRACTVFGRQHSVAARTLICLLRSRDWSHRRLPAPPHRSVEHVS